MSRMVAVVEEIEIMDALDKINPEDNFVFFTKGPEWSRDKFNEEDAKEFSNYDIVIIQKNREQAEELRKMILKFANKEIVIVRYLYDGYISKEGDYQVIKLNNNFISSDIYNSEYPWLEGYKQAIKMSEVQGKKI